MLLIWKVRQRTSAWYKLYVEATTRNVILPDIPVAMHISDTAIQPTHPFNIRKKSFIRASNSLVLGLTQFLVTSFVNTSLSVDRVLRLSCRKLFVLSP